MFAVVLLVVLAIRAPVVLPVGGVPAVLQVGAAIVSPVSAPFALPVVWPVAVTVVLCKLQCVECCPSECWSFAHSNLEKWFGFG